MKLTDKHEQIGDSTSGKVYFDDITAGEVFYYDGILYLRLDDEVKKMNNSREYNAVDLTDGSLASFNYDEEVGRFEKQPEVVYDSEDIRYYKK